MNSQKEKYLRIFNSINFHNIKDHPNILIAAYFWDEERYCAAKICYRFMRLIDDLIDNHKANNRQIAEEDREAFRTNVKEWLKMIIISDECNPMQKELKEIIQRFKIPQWTLEAFAKSMLYDINNDGFATLGTFLDYAGGASVAPASIFVHLSGLRQNNGVFEEPAFDVKKAATPCALFSYIVHIIRDFQKDQFNNLNYFADDLIKENNLSRQELSDIARGSPVSSGFRNLIRQYYDLADKYRLITSETINEIGPLLEPGSRMSLEIIFNLYNLAFERIDIERGNFTSFELNPTHEETRNRVYETIMNFNTEI